ncbi:inositol oxygenase 1-like [Malus domestica]|uniref:inositol oxygenase 1-like n=1 Tax=Malus domestica TaxID=3750 RepID=UPI0010AB2F46|nr:inositol oxygenase 1-like [Malus domestica]
MADKGWVLAKREWSRLEFVGWVREGFLGHELRPKSFTAANPDEPGGSRDRPWCAAGRRNGYSTARWIPETSCFDLPNTASATKDPPLFISFHSLSVFQCSSFDFYVLKSINLMSLGSVKLDWLVLCLTVFIFIDYWVGSTIGELPQWAVVGDTFPVGCAFDQSNVHHKYFAENPDYYNPSYNTKYGVYSEGCGLENVMMSWGHDDYMYLVATENKSTLPSAALFIIRYHSFYALHKAGAYKHLMNEEDVENLKWLRVFNKYDLYSKSKIRVDVEKVKPYYISLIEKYFPSKLRW